MPRPAEIHFQKLFESAPGLYLILLPDLNIAAVTKTYLQATMTRREDILGRGLFEVFPDNPGDPAASGVSNLRASLHHVLQNKTAHAMAVQKYDIRRPDGRFEERHWRPLNTPVLNDNNEVTYIIHQVEDVTEMLRMQQEDLHQRKTITETNTLLLNEIKAREHAEARINAIFSAAPDAIIVIDEKGVVVNWNPKAELLFGWKQEEVTGKSLTETIIPHRYRQAHKEGMKNFLETGEGPVLNKAIEIQALHKNNREFDVALSISPTLVNGEHLFIGFIRDITEQKKAEAEIAASNKRFSTVFNISPVAITINGQDRKFMYVNDAFAEISGFKKEEVIGKTSTELGITNAADQQKRVNQVLEAGGKAKGVEIKIRKAGGEMIDVINAVERIEIDNKMCWVSTLIDITGQKLAEAQIQKQKQELQDFMDSMSTLCAKVSTEGKLLLVNKTAMQASGLQMEELLRTSFTEGLWFTFDPEVHARVRRAFKKACSGIAVNYDEQIFVFGQPLVINFSLIPIIKPGGTVDYIVAEGRDISPQKKIEEAIRQLNAELEHRVEERTAELQASLREISDYKYAIDESSIVAITDQKGIIRHANDNFCRISKYSREELIGQDHRIINSGYHSKEFIRHLWTTIANGKIWKGELKNKAKDGTIYWVDTTIIPFLNNQDKPYQYVAIRADITERKKAEQALHESQQLLSAIIDNSTAVIYVKNLEGRYLLVNRRFNELFHPGGENVLGKTDYDFFPKAEADAFREMDLRTAAVDHAITGEEKVQQRDGLHTYISVKSRLHDYTGKPYAIFGISTDITDLKTVEENLRRSLRETSDYKFALDESSIVAITDQKGIIKYVNNNFCKISKYKENELIGQDHRIINSGYHSKEFIRNLWVTIANGKIWRGELKNKAKDGSIYWVDTTIVPFLNQEGKPYQYVAIRSDITGKKKAEKEIQQLNEELEQKVIDRTTQLESVNKELEAFSYSVSHDLRSPLRIIDGYADMLATDYKNKLDKEGNQNISIIKESAQRMGQLIDDLLNLSHTGRKELVMHTINMNELVQPVIDEQLLLSGNRADIQADKLEPAECDSNLLRQVWSNLIGNAIKYSATQQQPVVRISSTKKRTETVYSIADNGVGFDMRYVGKLFGVFQRLHKASEFEGTGVGLALVKRIITKHGGKVWVDAQPGKGATFYFSLPS